MKQIVRLISTISQNLMIYYSLLFGLDGNSNNRNRNNQLFECYFNLTENLTSQEWISKTVY